MSGEPSGRVRLELSAEEARALHAALEELLERGAEEPLGRVYRLLAWRTLAATGGSGLSGRLAEIARRSGSLEEFEAARDRELGPILEGLENPENRDP
ncbi:hypothetical protein Rxyl_1149 [Rubrobacter xylanophilus DSM 9941]|uniref:Uncharacterized protein n=1 Tax=Rubrobacter xylanophilus (strain DSM 9941 / JCM 11954 / NBRC 16129 / PRD-1) TaxID=266117 RepID=Q1AWW3_RUBXD|nr:hypothetical protein [Rubrobacter xylanophilus]ABG04115.1 hypothetical protein Rxyl_1149 [Rubrobacter xylanophilus DSM 9941]